MRAVIIKFNGGQVVLSLKTGVVSGLLLVAAATVQGQTSGIFADFTTSKGNFTCQLEYTKTPKTVANFIGLATGQRPWLDPATGLVRNDPFYNGITFHRVISGFMIQGGSPDGKGDDGPGYVFVDEFSALLTFNKPWVLAMANSGPDSNGSQFFVTVAPYSSGNNSYAVFGHVTDGTNVVAAINKVAVDSSNNNKPLTNVVIQSVTIRRVGAAAQAFDINAQKLPTVSSVPLQISDTGSNQVSLSFSNRLYADNRLFSSTNLANWDLQLPGIEIATPLTNSISRTNDVPARFFRLGQVQYATSILVPKNVYGRTLTNNFSGGAQLVMKFDNQGGGTYTLTGFPAGTITSYSFTQQPYRGILAFDLSGNVASMSLKLSYKSATNGTFSGTVYTLIPQDVTGTFTSVGP